MISAFALFMLAASLVVDPAIENYAGNETVTVLPSQTFVVCDDDCFQPTPKRKKVVLKRAPDKQTNTLYAGINEYLKDQQTKMTPQQKPRVETAYTVHFELDSSTISQKELVALQNWISKVKAAKYEVLGYTCQIGTEKHNQNLSHQRAAAVKKYIESKIKHVSVRALGMGMGHYISTKDFSLNRRVEIKVLHGVHTAPLEAPVTRKEISKPPSIRTVSPLKQTAPAVPSLTTVKVKKQPVKIIRIEKPSGQVPQKQEPDRMTSERQEMEQVTVSDVQGSEKQSDKIKVLRMNKTQSKENIEIEASNKSK